MSSISLKIKYNKSAKSNLDEWIATINTLRKKKKIIKNNNDLQKILNEISIKPINITFSNNDIIYKGDQFNNLLNTIRNLNVLIELIPEKQKTLKNKFRKIYTDLETNNELYNLATKTTNKSINIDNDTNLALGDVLVFDYILLLAYLRKYKEIERELDNHSLSFDNVIGELNNSMGEVAGSKEDSQVGDKPEVKPKPSSPVAERIGNFEQESNGCYLFATLQLLYSIPELRDLLRDLDVSKLTQSTYKTLDVDDITYNKAINLIIMLKEIFTLLEENSSTKIMLSSIDAKDLVLNDEELVQIRENSKEDYKTLIANKNYLTVLLIYILNVKFNKFNDAQESLNKMIVLFNSLINNKPIIDFYKKILYNDISFKKCKQGNEIKKDETENSDKYIFNNQIFENLELESELYKINRMQNILSIPIDKTTLQKNIDNYQEPRASLGGINIKTNKPNSYVESCKNDIIQTDGTQVNEFGEFISLRQEIKINTESRYIIIQLKRFKLGNKFIGTIVNIDPIIKIDGQEFMIQGIMHFSDSGKHYTFINFNDKGEPLSEIDSMRSVKPYKENKKYIDDKINTGYVYLYKRIL